MSKPFRTIIVAGNVLTDWHVTQICRTQRALTSWNWENRAKIFCNRGGTTLIKNFLSAAAGHPRAGNGLSDISIQSSPAEWLDPSDGRLAQVFWQLAAYRVGKKEVWRVENFLGMEPPHENAAQTGADPASLDWMKVAGDVPEADIVILDDADTRFRSHEELWPRAIREGGACQWIVLKTSHPVAQGALWNTLIRKHSERLIVILTADDLRLAEVQISRELSWERTTQDLMWELTHNPNVNTLTRSAHVLVSFDTAGAALLSRTPQQPESFPAGLLFFDPNHIEGSWQLENPGGMYGYTSCLASSIGFCLLQKPDGLGMHQGIQAGLRAVRALHQAGFGEVSQEISNNEVAIPFEAVASAIVSQEAPFAVVEIQDPMRFVYKPGPDVRPPLQPGYWTIMEDVHQDNLNELASRIVIEGPQHTLDRIPLGKFGHLLTVDRREIESYRSIRSLVGEYIRGGMQKRPLNIAVFGAPGSGKSFGVTQVANSLFPGQVQLLEFNLSQMKTTSDLIAALHQVRDVNLNNKIPLVFWDEFDSPYDGKPIGWLRYFLAPMQDGAFTEGQLTHALGRVIFVFAGGTCHSLEDFQNSLPDGDFRSAKGPDFVSRLKGFINIQGPNPQKDGMLTHPQDDPYFIIRRAILLHSIFKRNTPQLFSHTGGKERLNIDAGVLRALLHIDEYKHGIRSIESIIAMSLLADKASFERSGLPSESQINLHVDGQKFLSLLQQLNLEDELLETFAMAAHEVFCDGLVERGYRYGLQNDEQARTSFTLVRFEDLPEDLKQQNRNNVRSIPQKLAQAGYLMMPARSNEAPFDFPGEDLENLACQEHERWMDDKLSAGWRYAATTDPFKKTNNCLVAWKDLPEDEKEKDRDLVRGIPAILHRAGYTVMRSRKDGVS